MSIRRGQYLYFRQFHALLRDKILKLTLIIVMALSYAYANISYADEQVSIITNGNQNRPEIIALDNGGYVVGWIKRTKSKSRHYQIFFRIFNKSGQAISNKLEVSRSFNSNFFRMTSMGANGFLVTWKSYSEVSARFFDLNGNPTSDKISLYSDYYSSPADVIALRDGGFLLLSVIKTDISAHRYDKYANLIGDRIFISRDSNKFSENPKAVLLSGGGLVITWSSRNTPTSASQLGNRHIYARRYRYKGAAMKIVAEFQVTTDSPGNNDFPDIIGTDSGGFVIVWQWSKEINYSRTKILKQIYDERGNRIGGETDINQHYNSGLRQEFPKISNLANNNFIISYTIAGANFTKTNGISAQILDKDGHTKGDYFEVKSLSKYIPHSSNMTQLLGGSFVIVWQAYGYGQQGSNIYIYQKFYSDPQIRKDTDNDGISDEDELNITHTDPFNADSDGDGLSDGEEINLHATDPNDIDSDNDGLQTMQKFISTTLTLMTLLTHPV